MRIFGLFGETTAETPEPVEDPNSSRISLDRWRDNLGGIRQRSHRSGSIASYGGLPRIPGSGFRSQPACSISDAKPEVSTRAKVHCRRINRARAVACPTLIYSGTLESPGKLGNGKPAKGQFDLVTVNRLEALNRFVQDMYNAHPKPTHISKCQVDLCIYYPNRTSTS